MTKNILLLISILLASGCSVAQKKADGRYFDFATNNNSESSLWIEKIIIDGVWEAPGTGIMGCGTSNINGGGGVASPPYDAIAPQKTVHLVWYSWKENARLKATLKMPDSKVTNSLILDPPWLNAKEQSRHKSKLIIDFRNNKKVWLKLAKSTNPRSQDEIMILAEGYGEKLSEQDHKYNRYKEGEDYTIDCKAKRNASKELGYYVGTLEVYDKWYPGAPENKETVDE